MQTTNGTNKGLYWYREDPNRTIDKDISLAREVYRQKLVPGTPNVIKVNQYEFDKGVYEEVKNIEVIPAKNILRRHFLLLDNKIEP